MAVNEFRYIIHTFNMFHYQSWLHLDSGICTVLSLTGLLVPTVIDLPALISIDSTFHSLHLLCPPLHACAFCQSVFSPDRKINPTPVHACLACQTTAVLNSFPCFHLRPWAPSSILTVDLVSAAHLHVWFSEGRKLETSNNCPSLTQW